MEKLIDSVDDHRVEGAVVGIHLTAVLSRGLGLAQTTKDASQRGVGLAGDLIGRSAKEVAELLLSWNFTEASLGLAALNSLIEPQGKTGNGFDFIHSIKPKRPAVVGHFRNLDRSEFPGLTILERDQKEGDLPDPACEFILPRADFVLISASAFINKTIVRLLELSGEAFVVITGPSTPMSPYLFAHGVSALAGVRVRNPARALNIISQGGGMLELKPQLDRLISLRP